MTTKEIADSLNLPKQRVYRCIKRNNIKEAHHEVVKGNQVLMYDETAINRIKELFSSEDIEPKEVHSCIGDVDEEVHQRSSKKTHTEADEAHTNEKNTHHEAVCEAVIKSLTEQLAEKDKQIALLQEQLTAAHQLVYQEQQLHASTVKRLEQQSEEMVVTSEPEVTGFKGFFRRLFGGSN